MKSACAPAPGRGGTNLLLAELADRLTARGRCLCGPVQIDTARATQTRCDIDLRILPRGPVTRLSQDRGPAATACRRDTDALEPAVAATRTALAAGADGVILNEFGKHEVEGRGFRETIATALSKDVPGLVGANKLNLDATRDVSGGEIEDLPADLDALAAWTGGGRGRPVARTRPGGGRSFSAPDPSPRKPARGRNPGSPSRGAATSQSHRPLAGSAPPWYPDRPARRAPNREVRRAPPSGDGEKDRRCPRTVIRLPVQYVTRCTGSTMTSPRGRPTAHAVATG